jgi:ABC-type lipoprotein export system ATPase subunit/ABC-type antimicrobial peptide transport system permease subunit
MNDITKQKLLIEARGIVKNFRLADRTVAGTKQASFSIPDGSFTVIHGPSGSGKTTLLNILTGLDEPSEGVVLYQGTNLYDLPESELAHFRARTMGIVYQTSYWVKSLNVLENVALPLHFLGYDKADAEREARESLRRVGMEVHADTLPGLLSGGEQQRVAMARALVSNPDYIVADEPTGNLDSENSEHIMNLLDYFRKELRRTIILVTHNEEYLRYATHTMYIKDGVVTQASGQQEQVSPVAGRAAFSQMDERLRPIRLSMLLRMAFANIRAKKFRNNLTMLGVAIGVSSIFLLLSFGLGLQNLVQKEIIGTDSVRVINVTSVNSDVLKLDSAAVDKMSKISGVEKIGKQNTAAADFQLGSAKADSVVYGIDKEYLSLNNFTMVAGDKIQPDNLDELMVSESLLKTLGYGDLSTALGKKVSLTLRLDEGEKILDSPLKIVGVVKAESGSAMYVSQELYRQLGENNLKQLKVVSTDDVNVAAIRQQIETMGYQTSSPLDTIDQVNRFFKFFNILLVGFGGIGMLIAVIGMLNTLTVALLERTKEVGLMIALGARRRDMRRLFVTESMLLTMIGGVVGIVLSLGAEFIVNLVANQAASSRGVDESFSLFAVPAWLVLVTVLFMCFVGYIVSLLPARRAGRISPVEALRRE